MKRSAKQGYLLVGRESDSRGWAQRQKLSISRRCTGCYEY